MNTSTIHPGTCNVSHAKGKASRVKRTCLGSLLGTEGKVYQKEIPASSLSTRAEVGVVTFVLRQLFTAHQVKGKASTANQPGDTLTPRLVQALSSEVLFLVPSLYTDPDFRPLQYQKTGENSRELRQGIERTSEGNEFEHGNFTVQSNSSSTASKTMIQEFVDNWRIALTTVMA